MLAITSLLSTMNIPSDAHFASSASIQHPTPKQNMFPRMRTWYHQPTSITLLPSKTCSLGYALGIIIQHSSPNNQTKHVPSDAHFASFGELFS